VLSRRLIVKPGRPPVGDEMRIPWPCWRILLLGLILATCEPLGADADQRSRVAAVLFDQFETVFYSDTDLLANPGVLGHLSALEATTVRYPFAYLLGALEAADTRASQSLLDNARAVLVGAKDFRPPTGFGGVSSRRCYVVVLRPGNGFDLAKYFRKPISASTTGSPVWNWQAKLKEFGEGNQKPSSLYASQVERSYVLVSNDLQELQTIAERLTSPGDELKGLSEIHDWETVSSHQYWGYRRYRQTGIVDRMAAGMNDVTSGAQALVFFSDPEKKTGTIRLLCTPADEGTVAKMNASAMFLKFRSRGAGTWERTIQFTGDEDGFDQLFAVMFLFGFGVYV
jgi:hypothetical protein